ncbi:hypothetical protein LZ32DRAFT_152159 [Colletotrichum eremochloae]|nr:hypothetical protein LZ32DRAFT_152159 [Colletotrichum eremochloae]
MTRIGFVTMNRKNKTRNGPTGSFLSLKMGRMPHRSPGSANSRRCETNCRPIASPRWIIKQMHRDFYHVRIGRLYVMETSCICSAPSEQRRTTDGVKSLFISFPSFVGERQHGLTNSKNANSLPCHRKKKEKKKEKKKQTGDNCTVLNPPGSSAWLYP